MRQLFLPACICLVTWSGPTNPEARLTLEEFTGRTLPHIGVANAATPAIVPNFVAETSGSGSGDVRAEWRDARTVDLKPSIDIKIPDEAIAIIEPAPVVEASLEPTKPAQKSYEEILANLSIEYPVPSGVVVNGGIPEGIPLPPIAKPVVERSTEEICHSLTKSAQINDIPAPFFIRLLFQESGFKPGAVSPVGAQGIAQFMPATAVGMGVSNPFDPREAIPASARLLNELLQQFGNLGLAAAAYNAGPKRISDWLASKGKGKLPEETQGYVKTITGKTVEHWTQAQAKHPGAKLPKRAPCQESAGLLAYNGPDNVPMPQASPLRSPEKLQDKTPEKAVIVAARSDVKHADRAERIADAAKTVTPKIVATKSVAPKETIKLTAAAPVDTKPAVAKVAGARQSMTIKITATGVTTTAKTDSKASAKIINVKRRIKTADAAPGKPLNIAQQ
ncbi:MAG: lytic transglycosylase domain-containing protein [Pseudolabrys sp.]|nr:lytic transglycosylase domain-containing protein [Pseudolabrys sp.]